MGERHSPCNLNLKGVQVSDGDKLLVRELTHRQTSVTQNAPIDTCPGERQPSRNVPPPSLTRLPCTASSQIMAAKKPNAPPTMASTCGSTSNATAEGASVDAHLHLSDNRRTGSPSVNRLVHRVLLVTAADAARPATAAPINNAV